VSSARYEGKKRKSYGNFKKRAEVYEERRE